jgi:hypothetical protein
MAEPSATESTAQPALSPADYESGPRWKRTTATVLLVSFCIFSAFAVPAIWARNQITNTDRYVRTVEPLASDPAIQNAIAAKISNTITGRLDTQTLTGEALSSRQQALRAPIASAMNSYIDGIVKEVIDSSEFQQFWVDANRAVHSVVSAILAGKDTGAVQLNNGALVFDLQPLFAEVQNRLVERGIDAAGRIQLDNRDTTFVLFESPELAKAQNATSKLEGAAIILPILALLALGGYLILSKDRRRSIIMAGLSLALTMAVLLLLLALARWRYLDRLSPDRDRDAMAAFFDTLLRYLRAGLRLMALVGVLAAGIAYITQSTGRIAQARRSASVWLSSTWRDAGAKWPWLGSAADGIRSHRREIWIALLAFCSLIVIVSDRITLGIVILIAVIIVAGSSLISLISSFAAKRKLSAVATVSPQPETTVAVEAPPAVAAKPVEPSPAVAPAQPAPLQLSEEDAKILHRLAVLLRETPSESGAS